MNNQKVRDLSQEKQHKFIVQTYFVCIICKKTKMACITIPPPDHSSSRHSSPFSPSPCCRMPKTCIQHSSNSPTDSDIAPTVSSIPYSREPRNAAAFTPDPNIYCCHRYDAQGVYQPLFSGAPYYLEELFTFLTQNKTDFLLGEKWKIIKSMSKNKPHAEQCYRRNVRMGFQIGILG